MSPLTPEQKAAYGPDWPEVSAAIRERAGQRCECGGECGWRRHLDENDRLTAIERMALPAYGPVTRCTAMNGKPSPHTGSLVVLTVAHLDRNGHEGVNDPNRLKAMCNGCHLAYDRPPYHPAALEDLIEPEEFAAVTLMRDRFGMDPARTFQFWEHFTARMLDGSLTAPSEPWDVEVEVAEETLRVEVKYAQEITVKFANGPRRVFKWAGLRPDPRVTAVVMYGIDAEDHVFMWVAPPTLITASTLTLTSPRDRRQNGGNRSPLTYWHYPCDQLIPGVCDAARWNDDRQTTPEETP